MNIVWISNILVERLFAEADRVFPLETGGVLMGYVAGEETVISEIIGPGPNAVHRVYSFAPDYSHHEIEVARLYQASCRKWTYLGDWHSHPRQKTPDLSIKDVQTLRHIARSKKARMAFPLMMISSGQPNGWKLNVWQLETGKIFSLKSRVVHLPIKAY
jgi:integrative and conjugative element protein (TIGR02256 family)